MKLHVRLTVLLCIISTILLTGFTCSKQVPQPAVPQEKMTADPTTTDTTTTE